MVALLIVVSVVSLSNIAGQQYTVRQEILRPESTPALRDSQRSISQELKSPPLRYSMETINQYIANRRTSASFDEPEQNIARDPVPQKRVTSRSKNTTTSRTNQKQREGSNLSEKHSGKIDVIQNCSLVCDSFDFKDNKNSTFNRHPNLNESTDSTNIRNYKNGSKEIKAPVSELLPPLHMPETTDKTLVPGAEDAEKLNTTGITVDSRDSFNGDKCATGHIRVNDKCVPVD